MRADYLKSLIILVGFIAITCSADELKLANDSRINALLITSGCCHDYELQTKSLIDYSEQQADILWTVVKEGGTDRTARITFYDDPAWARPYDVVVYNNCFPNVGNAEYLRRITKVHQAGKPAVIIHCAVHSHSVAVIDDWRELVGVTSYIHDRETNYYVNNIAPAHPVMQGFPVDGWTTPSDELYLVIKKWPNTEVLATTTYEETGMVTPVVWTNTYGKARVFGTSYGHSNETFEDETFLNLITLGILWAADVRPLQKKGND